MDNNKKAALNFIDEKQELITEVSHKIWEYAELSLKEYKSANLYVEKLKEEGFEVEECVCGIDTAFSGKFGSGRPYIGILGEFDALAGISQVGNSLEKKILVKGAGGHGCGHNMLGAGAFGAALGVKSYLEKTGKSGTVFFYGCPGEEGGASKALMARDGVWKNLDIALSWHPGDTNEIMTGTTNACIQELYKFKGVASHAAGNPEDGRSALDAVELMNTGVQYLREHMKQDARIHYAITNAGGVSPNVVQPAADVLYMIRSPKAKDAIELAKRVEKLAQGAAIMTETEYEKIFVDGLANLVPNTAAEKVIYDNMQRIGVPEYTDAEWEFAKQLKTTYKDTTGDLPGTGVKSDKEIARFVKEKSENGTRAINDFLMPFYSGDDFSPGSTDVGDVSWLVPTAQMNAVTWPSGAPGHSWQNVSCACSTIGDKGLIYAAKVLCGAAIDFIEDENLIKEAKAEFEKRTREGYFCPVPEGVKLYVIED